MSVRAAPHRQRARRPGAGALALVLAVSLAVGLSIGVIVSLSRGRALPSAGALAAVPAPVLRGQATWPRRAPPAPPIRGLIDQAGAPFSLAATRGRPVAIAFLDSRCAAACPLEGRALAAAEASLPLTRRPVLVVVSVNPLDTPASTRHAVGAWGLGRLGPWYWLRGTRRALAAVWSAYDIAVAIPRGGGDIVHTEALLLLDRRGEERSGYLYPFVARSVRSDLAYLAGGRTP